MAHDLAVKRKWTDADSDELRRLNAEGKSLGAVARMTGWAVGTVSKKAAGMGLTWVGRMPPVVEVARRERNDRIREEVLEAFWEQAQAFMARLAAEKFKDLVRCEGGSEGDAVMDFVPSRSARDLSTAALSLAKAAAMIESARAGQQDPSDMRVFLTYMRGTVDTTQLDIPGGDHARGSSEGVHVEPGGTASGVPGG